MPSSRGTASTTISNDYSTAKNYNNSNCEDDDDEKKMYKGSTTSTCCTTTTTTIPTTHQGSNHFYCSWIAGVASGAVSSVLVAPLDVLRTQWQVIGSSSPSSTAGVGGPSAVGQPPPPYKTSSPMKLVGTIWKREGIPGFFRGLTATLVTVPAFWGVYFPLYEEFKETGERLYTNAKNNNNNINNNNTTTVVPPAMVHMGSAVLAGGIADVLINPLFMVRTRMQTEGLHASSIPILDNNNINSGTTTSTTRRTSFYQTIRNLYREGGLLIFWRGMTANLLGLTHVAVQFPIYEQLKQYLRQQQQHQPGDTTTDDTTKNDITRIGEKTFSRTALELLTASAISKMCACILTYPHEVIRSRLMDSRATQVALTVMCRDIYQAHGLSGFYAGLPLSMIRVVPNTAIAFCVYEIVLLELKQQQQQSSSS